MRPPRLWLLEVSVVGVVVPDHRGKCLLLHFALFLRRDVQRHAVGNSTPLRHLAVVGIVQAAFENSPIGHSRRPPALDIVGELGKIFGNKRRFGRVVGLEIQRLIGDQREHQAVAKMPAPPNMRRTVTGPKPEICLMRNS